MGPARRVNFGGGSFGNSMSELSGKPFKRVLCIVPPTGKFIREDRCQTPISKLKTVSLRPPIDLMYAASSFEAAGCEVKLTDYPAEEIAWPEFEAEMKAFKPDALVLSITTPTLGRDLEAAVIAKRIDPNVVTMAKGAHFNTLDVKSLEDQPALDLVLRGEYEHTCRELGEGKPWAEVAGITWRNAEGAVVRNAERAYEQNLETIAFPARHLTKNHLYTRPDTGAMQTTLITNRGCPFTCIYCLAQQVAGSKNRYRPVQNVVDEIRECVEKHNIKSFLFRSDLFTQNKKWVIELCKAILDAGLEIDWACNSRVDTITAEAAEWMRKAGCWIVAMGVERGDQESLDKIEKKAKVEDAYRAVKILREAGIKSSVYLLMGLPWDTHELIERQIEFAKDLDPDFLEVFYVYPFPGTTLYTLCVKEGLIKDGEIPPEGYADPTVNGLYLSIEDFKRLRQRALRKYYMRPKIVLRTLKNARSAGELMNYVRKGVQQAKDLIAG